MQRPLLGISMFLIALFYCALLAAGNFFIYQQQKQSLYHDFEALQTIELNLLADLSQEGLLTQNYAFIDWFIKRWGREHNKVISISLDDTRGYALTHYRRAVSAQAEMLVSTKKLTMHDGTYILKISTDTVELERKLDELLLQLFLVSVGATMLLIILLWLVFHKYAIQPLAEEVKRRQKAENKLEALEAGE
ncbi:MAG: hypothetical protein QNJ56_10835 [Gammaproteobacteria bacterium]|nr:hypothetical protein [Gammaproteobacteria bacterium]